MDLSSMIFKRVSMPTGRLSAVVKHPPGNFSQSPIIAFGASRLKMLEYNKLRSHVVNSGWVESIFKYVIARMTGGFYSFTIASKISAA